MADEHRSDAAYHHGDLWRALIAAGRTVLLDNGVARVSIREVARVAGVSHNAPYRHFESREALLAAIAADGFDQLSARMTSSTLDAEANKTGHLVTIGRAYLNFAAEFPSLYRLMFSSEIRKSAFPALRIAADRAYEQLVATVSQSSADPRDMALGAWALVHGLADLQATGQLSEDLQGKRLQDAIDHMLEAFAAGAAK